MDAFTNTIVSNVAFSTILALLTYCITRVWRNPHFANVMWMLVLVKLLTPPIVSFPFPLLVAIGEDEVHDSNRRAASRGVEPSDSFVDETASNLATTANLPVANHSRDIETPAKSARRSIWLGSIAFVWFGGAMALAILLMRRCMQFRRLVQRTKTPDDQLLESIRHLTRVMGLARSPTVRLIDARIPPLVWSVWFRPTVLLPAPLCTELGHSHLEAILIHELAHIRRRDYLVRWLDTLAIITYWWNPIVWWARRQVRVAEEECCDAWVVWALPKSRRTYGEALVRTHEFLSQHRGVPIMCNTFGRHNLTRRIEMITKHNVRHRVSWRVGTAALLFTTVFLPVSVQMASNATESKRDTVNDNGAANQSESPEPELSAREANDKLEAAIDAIHSFDVEFTITGRHGFKNSGGEITYLENERPADGVLVRKRRYRQVYSRISKGNASQRVEVLTPQTGELVSVQTFDGNELRSFRPDNNKGTISGTNENFWGRKEGYFFHAGLHFVGTSGATRITELFQNNRTTLTKDEDLLLLHCGPHLNYVPHPGYRAWLDPDRGMLVRRFEYYEIMPIEHGGIRVGGDGQEDVAIRIEVEQFHEFEPGAWAPIRYKRTNFQTRGKDRGKMHFEESAIVDIEKSNWNRAIAEELFTFKFPDDAEVREVETVQLEQVPARILNRLRKRYLEKTGR